MMAIQKNISLYEVYEDYRAEKMGKRFFKTGFNTMLVLVQTVGTKVGTNFLNNQKKIDFFQRNFFFKGNFFQKLLIFRKKWYPFLHFLKNENFV